MIECILDNNTIVTHKLLNPPLLNLPLYGQFSHLELSDQDSLSQHSEITAPRN